jgi:hypothetical protein
LNPGDSIVVSVHYAPAAAGQPEMGQLDVGGGRSVKHVPLNGNSPAGSDCRLQALPDLLTFGVVPIGQSVSRSLTLTNVSSVTPCRLNGAMVDASSAPGFTVPAVPPTIDPLQNARVTVTFQPTAAGEARGRIHFASNDPRSPTDVAVFATVPPPGICVAPRVLSFGQVQTSRDIPFNITACGPQAVTVTGLPFTQPDAQFSLVSPPQIPFTLQAGATQAISVRYTPSPRSMGARAVVTVNSSDAMDPAIPVMLDGGPAIVPPSAGQYLYYWSVPPGSLGDQGDVFRLPLQGGMTSQPYWGSSTGQNCSGCHALSRDGKYLALIDYSFVPGIRIIDTARNMELGVRFRAPQAFLTSWRPDSATNPAYQFAYDDGTRVQIASIAGNIRTLQGTESPNEVNRMPNWGPNGKIAFVRGQTDFLAPGGFGMSGTSDVMIVDEGGGTPVRLNGASQNGMLNFYPSYSPDAPTPRRTLRSAWSPRTTPALSGCSPWPTGARAVRVSRPGATTGRCSASAPTDRAGRATGTSGTSRSTPPPAWRPAPRSTCPRPAPAASTTSRAGAPDSFLSISAHRPDRPPGIPRSAATPADSGAAAATATSREETIQSRPTCGR